MIVAARVISNYGTAYLSTFDIRRSVFTEQVRTWPSLEPFIHRSRRDGGHACRNWYLTFHEHGSDGRYNAGTSSGQTRDRLRDRRDRVARRYRSAIEQDGKAGFDTAHHILYRGAPRERRRKPEIGPVRRYGVRSFLSSLPHSAPDIFYLVGLVFRDPKGGAN